MILLALILIPLAAGLIAWLASLWSPLLARLVSLGGVATVGVLVIVAFTQHPVSHDKQWLAELDLAWIPQFGISLHLAADGLSLVLIALTSLIGVAAVITSWQVTDRIGFFQFNLTWTLGGITGVFLAIDLFLFYFFWELMLVPMYLLFLWGGRKRGNAALKFFIFSQAGGLLMLVAILSLYVSHGQATGNYTFDYNQLILSPLGGPLALLVMLGFFVGFAVKLPAFPLHTWLPDAYAESPTAATVLLAALMSKTAAYGLLRFIFPLFPEAARSFAPVAMALGAAGILYGALLAFGQTDLKRLIAYSSLSHMGFVVVGIFAWNTLALQGSVMQMIAHGLSTAGIFIIAGIIERRSQTRELDLFGGLWSTAPRLSTFLLVFALASMALPGMANFVAEFMVLLGAFQASPLVSVAAAFGVVLSAIYALWLVQRTLHGPTSGRSRILDISGFQSVLLGTLVAAIIWLGLAPQTVLTATNDAILNLETISQPQPATIAASQSSFLAHEVVR